MMGRPLVHRSIRRTIEGLSAILFVAGCSDPGGPGTAPVAEVMLTVPGHVLVGGVTPVNTNLIFDKFSECLDAEVQMRQHYANAFEAWDRSAAANTERRRDYRRARDTQAKRLLGNVGTCIPHADGNQPQIVTPQQPTTSQSSQPTTQPSPRP